MMTVLPYYLSTGLLLRFTFRIVEAFGLGPFWIPDYYRIERIRTYSHSLGTAGVP